MKMTMHIDDELLARVMEATGAASKTKAIDLALREMDRKAKLIKLSTAGLGLGPDELKETIDPGYDLEARRGSKTPSNCSGVGQTSGLPVRGASGSVTRVRSKHRAGGPPNRQTRGLPHPPA